MSLYLSVTQRIQPLRNKYTGGLAQTRRSAPKTRYTARNYNRSAQLREGEDKPENTEEMIDLDDNQDMNDPREQAIINLNEQIEELNDKYARALAEVENTRKILQRDVQKAKDFGIKDLVKGLLNVTDILNLSLENRPDFEDENHKDNDVAKNAFAALDATKKEFEKVLAKHEVEEYTPEIGSEFDSNFHDALIEVPAPNGSDAAPGTIGLVMKSGWKRKDALIRAAVVGVVKSN
eukprot:TRINITY_DN11158_c0_g1_i1.p1 TRINITY_DN11158_c0_g1~~TRINITY_DN11158_c0_g1_i1.p1  ORF type:complete len:235 (-),score=82.98 TRINITY_DN11158_c0_g1_i1:65-769(-)